MRPPTFALGLCTILAQVYALQSSDDAIRHIVRQKGKADDTPTTPYGPDWQEYFHVKDTLPDISFPLPTSFAGSLSVNRQGHPDNALFFWAFESSPGSLAAQLGEQQDRPWAVWLNGGPGSSSMNGLMNEIGPFRVGAGRTIEDNSKYAWSQVADYFFVDQPVGVGYSTAEDKGYVADQPQIGEDFVNFLANVVAVFPSLATRPFYLTGESYAGRYIPYIAQALFMRDSPPVRLAKIAIGDPALGSNAAFKTMPVLQNLATHPAIIGWDSQVYEYFKDQTALCGLNIDLSFPQATPLPWIQVTNEGDSRRNRKSSGEDERGLLHRRGNENSVFADIATLHHARGTSGPTHGRDLENHKRDLSLRANGTIDPWYGCDLYNEMVDYAVNYTWPWTESKEFDNFDAVDAVNPDVPTDPAFFLNDPAVRKALHAPKKTWQMSTNYPWNSVDRGGDPSPESMTFLSDLARSASARGVQFVFFVGNDDAISPAFGTLASIQNTTFGDTRGFTKRPSTPWYADDGSFAGIVHAERNLTFAIVYGTGHQIAINQPAASFAFARDFIFGSNSSALQADLQAGRLADNPSLGQSALPAAAQVKYGQGTRTSMTTAPTESVASFYSAIGVLVPTGTDGGGTAAGSRPTSSGKSDAGKMLAGTKGSSLVLGLALGISIMTGLC